MIVIRAAAMGMCFGVRDALALAESIRDAEQVTIHGQLVHNPAVIAQLAAQGFQQAAEDRRGAIPGTPRVLITAHGVSEVERHRLRSAGKELIDTTCPLVRRVHEAAKELQAEGRLVLVLGQRGHVEVQGIVEDLHAFEIIGSPEEVRSYDQRRLGIVCQTTMAPDAADAILAQLQLLNPLAEMRHIDTICQPTRLRQRAMLELVARVDAVVVVGGRNSNNTRQLVRLCHDRLTPVLHVEHAGELEPEWFDDVAVVGLTAGTSTLDSTIDAVHQALVTLGTRRTKGVLHVTSAAIQPVDAPCDADRAAP
jgi:4-hydroxy-3-methylbut-2-en-1-yl diphosphate reductase